MPTEYAFPYAFDLTEAQFNRLLGLVQGALYVEAARAARMADRPAGSHGPAAIASAEALVAELAELEAALLAGSRGNS